jgi:hypothetical protein
MCSYLETNIFLQALHFFVIQFKLKQNTKNGKGFSTKCMNWWTLTMQQMSMCQLSVVNPKPDIHDILPDGTERGLLHLQRISHH